MSDLTMVRGDTQVFQGTARDAAGVGITDAGAACKVSVKDEPSAAAVLFTRSSTGLSAGVGLVTLQPADTTSLTVPAVLFWDFQVTLTGGAIKTLDSGHLVVMPEAST